MSSVARVMRRRGFTLLEVLLAIALTMVIAGTTLGLASVLLERRTQIDESASRDRGVAILMDQVEQDLLGVVASANGESGLVGTARELTLRARGVTMRHEDVIDVRYAFVASGDGALKPGRIVASRGRGNPDETLADGVALMRLRYHDGVAWVDTYDSKSQANLPWAVEVAVWFGDPAEFSDEDETANEDGVLGETVTGAEGATEVDDGERPSAPAASEDVVMRAPDRVRVIVVPDGAGPSAIEGSVP